MPEYIVSIFLYITANKTVCILFKHHYSLSQLIGDLILFAPEGEGLEWCGSVGRSCLECTEDIVGNEVEERCATRLVSRTMATHLDQLAHWVLQNWGDEGCKYRSIIFLCCYRPVSYQLLCET